MKIVVTGDTHMPMRGKKLPSKLIESLSNADLILHVGDWSTIEVYDELTRYAPVEGVVGNVDQEEIQKRFAQKKIITLDKVRIGLTHGHGKGKTTEKRAIDMFKDDAVDIVTFGHSHIPVLHHYNDLITFNPGSPTDKRRQNQYSFGIIQISETVAIQHVYYDTKE